jgi:hypothetical protein
VTKTPTRTGTSSAARRAHRGSLTLAAAVAALLAWPAQPQVLPSDEDVARALDVFNPYASLGFAYDSNIFRLDDDAPEIGDTNADEYGTLAVGFDSHFEQAVQSFDVNAEVNHTLYLEHDDLDYTGSKANAVWHWVASEATRGDLGIRHRRALRDFANQSTLERQKDIRMENALFASGDVSLPSKVTFGGRAEFADIAFSDTDRLDLQRITVAGDAGFVSTSGNRIGLDAEYVMGRYDNNPISDFDEYTVGPKFEWKVGARTGMSATVGYTARDYDDESRTDYDGVTGRFEVTMDDDGSNSMTASVYRDLSNLGDEIAEYAVVTGAKIEPIFSLRDNLDLRLLGGIEKREFNRDADLGGVPLPLDADRDDDVYTIGAFVDWDIHKNIKLSFGADMQKRDSTRDLQDYDFARAQVRVTGHL